MISMKTDCTVLARFRNKEQTEYLVDALRSRGYNCYNFCDTPADPHNPEASPEDQMMVVESVYNFLDDLYFQEVFEEDLADLKNAETVITLFPASNSVHVEAGIAYGLGKNDYYRTHGESGISLSHL